jgi:type 1 glutamine amidotransferase
MKNILLVTDGFVHPPYGGRRALHRALAQLEGYSFRHARSLGQLPVDVDSYAALVLYYHHKIISAAALDRLDSFVKNGGGVLAIHSATASFKDQPHYFDIIGGRFTGHGPVENFEVQQVKGDVFGEIGDFIVKDELYLHELHPGIDVHFEAQHAGQAVPVVWTYRYGQGKVCYAVPGHTAESMKHPAMQEILRRGLQWVCPRGTTCSD